jgi:hypothetical protein
MHVVERCDRWPKLCSPHYRRERERSLGHRTPVGDEPSLVMVLYSTSRSRAPVHLTTIRTAGRNCAAPETLTRWPASRAWRLHRQEAEVTRQKSAKARAQALFKKEVQAQLGQEAMSQYRAEQEAVIVKTARLRALRLARDQERTTAVDGIDAGPRSGRVR